jgi:hypothetical protein
MIKIDIMTSSILIHEWLEDLLKLQPKHKKEYKKGKKNNVEIIALTICK